MRIMDVHVENYGVWSDLHLHDLSPQLTVLFGRNEAGKTTLLDFVRTVFYGFSEERRARYARAENGRAASGGLRISLEHGIFDVRRHMDADSDAKGTLTVHDGEHSAQGSGALAGALRNVDEATFNNVFAIGLWELQQLATLNDTDAAKWLYRIASGLDRVSLVDVMQQLTEARNRLLGEDPAACRVGSLMQQHRQAEDAASSASSLMEKWQALGRRNQELQTNISEVKKRLPKWQRRADLLERATAVRDAWLLREERRAELARLDPAAGRFEERLEQLDELNREIESRQQQLETWKRTYRDLRVRSSEIPINRHLFRNMPKIETLGEQRGLLESLESQVRAADAERVELEKQWHEQARQHGIQGDVEQTRLPREAQRAMKSLRKPARALREARQRAEKAREEAERCHRAATSAVEELRGRSDGISQGELAAEIEAAGQRVTQLEQRIGVDEQIDQLSRQKVDLEQQNTEMLEQQGLPVWTLAATGALFVMGGVMMLAALWFPASVLGSWGTTLAILGICGMALAGVMKIWLERSETQRLQRTSGQLELLLRQLDQAKSRREELDRLLPAGTGALAVRLQEAERALAELEELLPLDAQRHTLQRDAQQAAARAEQAQQQWHAARQQWQQALAAAHLPNHLSPRAVKKLAGGGRVLAELRTRIGQQEEAHHARKADYRAFCDRLQSIVEQVDLPVQNSSGLETLDELIRAAERHEPLVDQWRALRKQARQLRRNGRQVAREIRASGEERARLLHNAGVRTEQQFRERALQAARLRQLEAECNRLTEQIQARAGDAEQQLRELIESRDAESLADDLGKTQRRITDGRKNLEQWLAESGSVGQQLAHLGDDRTAGQARLALKTADIQLRRACQRWKDLALISLLLKDVLRRFERDHQPDSLVQASQYFRRLTGDRYHRVWTPLDEDMLFVESSEGEAQSVDSLSSGTREQLFLSLRLALVDHYARRGTRLPVVLDDVLVNFDSERAREAARLLVEFTAKDHQLLLFTCHEHILAMFQSLHVDTRELTKSNAHTVIAQRELPPAAPVEVPIPKPTPGETAPAATDETPPVERDERLQEPVDTDPPRDEEVEYTFADSEDNEPGGEPVEDHYQLLDDYGHGYDAEGYYPGSDETGEESRLENLALEYVSSAADDDWVRVDQKVRRRSWIADMIADTHVASAGLRIRDVDAA